jgi:hypothetical protein
MEATKLYIQNYPWTQTPVVHASQARAPPRTRYFVGASESREAALRCDFCWCLFFLTSRTPKEWVEFTALLYILYISLATLSPATPWAASSTTAVNIILVYILTATPSIVTPVPLYYIRRGLLTLYSGCDTLECRIILSVDLDKPTVRTMNTSQAGRTRPRRDKLERSGSELAQPRVRAHHVSHARK